MIIKTLSHELFDTNCYKLGVYDDNVNGLINTTAFISIIGTKECRKYYLEDGTGHWFKKNHPNVLNLEFDDVTEDIVWNGHNFLAMNEEQAKQCVEFIENNKGKNFYIHCRAGISRSGAVSQFIYDFYNQDNIYDEENFKRFNSHIRPNNHVLRLLKRAFYEKNNLFVDENIDF